MNYVGSPTTPVDVDVKLTGAVLLAELLEIGSTGTALVLLGETDFTGSEPVRNGIAMPAVGVAVMKMPLLLPVGDALVEDLPDDATDDTEAATEAHLLPAPENDNAFTIASYADFAA